MRKAKQRNFVPARTGFIAVFVLILSTLFYDIVYKLSSSKYDTGLAIQLTLLNYLYLTKNFTYFMLKSCFTSVLVLIFLNLMFMHFSSLCRASDLFSMKKRTTIL